MTNGERESYTVLVGDDSEDDRLFMRRILRRLPEITLIEEAQTGDEVISYLTGLFPFEDRKAHPLPDLLILDLKMPCQTGHDVLRWLSEKGRLDEVAVIIVSGSSLPEDVANSLALGAAAYHRKSAEKEEQALLVDKVRAALRHIPTA